MSSSVQAEKVFIRVVLGTSAIGENGSCLGGPSQSGILAVLLILHRQRLKNDWGVVDNAG